MASESNDKRMLYEHATPLQLEYFHIFFSLEEALNAERQIKGLSRGKKR